ncbi:hypothetical protein Tco_1473156, partial [Tanacetum coccineum]
MPVATRFTKNYGLRQRASYGERKEGNLIIISLSSSSSSSSMAEVTMICVDNSGFMCGMYGGLGLMKAQTDAIELYFSAKLEAHPDNLV